MALSAIFGITNDGLNLAVNLLLLFLVVLWLALIFWTHADAKRRIADPMLAARASARARRAAHPGRAAVQRSARPVTP